MAIILDGKTLARKIEAQLKAEIEAAGNVRPPKLAVVSVGADDASKVYIRQKQKAAERCGIDFVGIHFPTGTGFMDVYYELKGLSIDDSVDGIIQQPTSYMKNVNRIVSKAIRPSKDVDGIGGDSPFEPCTPKGIIRLLDEYGIEIAGKNVCIIGRSNIVGRPLARMMLDRDATVTICHSKTEEIWKPMSNADIIVSAIGKPNRWGACYFHLGTVLIDVGINRVDGKLVGDFDHKRVDGHAGYLTPVPGGVGPMTVAMLMENTVEAWRRNVCG